MAQSITLQTSDGDIIAEDVLGRISFAASNESSGADAILIGGSIYAVAESTFTEVSNATSIVFATSNSEAASDKLKITSLGHFLPITTRSYDLGSSDNEFRQLYLYNVLYFDNLAFIDRANKVFGADNYALASGVIIDGGTP